MPRQSRVEIPGLLYHVMARGVGGNDIFLDDKDRDRFLDRFGELILKSDHQVYAWTLMNNHFHLLIRLGKDSLGTTLKRVLTSHAVYFNRRHKRFGHLFQNRYKAILCQEDTYFVRLVRYIHLNPLRAGVVKDIEALNAYQYSGHAYLMGKAKNDWQDTDYPLSWYGKGVRQSRQAYLDFMKEGISDTEREELRGGGLLRTAGGRAALQAIKKRGEFVLGDERVLGDTDFVEEALKKTERSRRQTAKRIPDYDLETLTKVTCQSLNVSPEEVRGSSKQRQVKKARDLICHFATLELKLKNTEIADYLNVSQSTVSRAASKYLPDESLKKLIQLLNERIA